MIKLVKQGLYQIIQGPTGTKSLILDNHEYFGWVTAQGVGEILVASTRQPKVNNQIARGKYRFYQVIDEPKLTDLAHLELYVGEGIWQGYLLPTGLPSKKDNKNRIIPTSELITETSRLRLLNHSSV